MKKYAVFYANCNTKKVDRGISAINKNIIIDEN